MSIRQDYVDAVGQLVQGGIPLADADKTLAVNMAVKMYSKNKPLRIIEDFNGDGGFDYAINTFVAWLDGFSVIGQVEYPVDDDDPDPAIIDDDEWIIYEKPDGKYLRFVNDSPAATESFRVTYTGLHTCDETGCTISAFDEEAVQALAAANFCEMLATYYAQANDSTINADSVEHKSRASEYAARARALRNIYLTHMGIQDGKTKPASVTYDQDSRASWGGSRITHNQRHR